MPPNWMLDTGDYADMTLGAPQVNVAALKDLRQLLIDRGFRVVLEKAASSQDLAVRPLEIQAGSV